MGVAGGNNLFTQAPPFGNLRRTVDTPSLLKSAHEHTHDTGTCTETPLGPSRRSVEITHGNVLSSNERLALQMQLCVVCHQFFFTCLLLLIMNHKVCDFSLDMSADESLFE